MKANTVPHLRPTREMKVELRGGAHGMLIQDTGRRTFHTLESGAIAQLVERYNGIVEVRGSTPLGSTG